jgi:DNA-binding SARP family transcriptional activator
VCRDGIECDLGTPKARLLLAVLLSQAGRPVSEELLAGALWGDDRPKSAVKNVQTYVHRLRQRLGESARLVRQGSGYLVTVVRDELDSARFEDLAASGRGWELAGDLEVAGRRLHEALRLWRGPAFAGMTEVTMLAAEAARLDEIHMSVLERRIDVDLRLGNHAELLGELTVLTGQYPLRERLWAQLMLALYRCGRRADALTAYSRARRTLVEEIGLDPGEELRQLHQDILDQNPSLNLLRPAATVVAKPPDPGPSMLPSALGDFTGRQEELAEIADVLGRERDPDGPAVVTVSGRAGAVRDAGRDAAVAVHFRHGARPVPASTGRARERRPRR